MRKFSQEELQAAYQQMADERSEDHKMALRAAEKLSIALGEPPTPRGDWPKWQLGDTRTHWLQRDRVSPHPVEHSIVSSLCQYDDWKKAHDELSKVCKMEPYLRTGGGCCERHEVKGVFDLSNDPEFANARQKVFRVEIEFYDSHSCGF